MLNKFVVKLIKKLYFAKIKLIVILLSLKKKSFREHIILSSLRFIRDFLYS